MSLVLDASIGESNNDDIAVEAAAIKTDAIGAVEVNIDELGIAPVFGGTSISASAIPKIAANKPRRNGSSVRNNTLYMNVVFVPRHSESTPLLADNEDNASNRE